MSELQMQKDPSSRGSVVLQYLLVGLLAGVTVGWRLGSHVLEDHECKLALAAQGMATSDEWLVEGAELYDIPEDNTFNRWMVPVENGHPRLVKTPLPYWVVSLIAKTGLGVNEWTARLPSAMVAVLTCMLVLALGRRMFSGRAAFYGALMFAVSFGLQKWARNARPELMLCFFMTLSMLCFYLGMEAKTRWRQVWWMVAFWVSMGLGNLAKEFVPVLLAWPLAAYVFWRQSEADKDDLTGLRQLRAFLIASGVGLVVHISVVAFGFLHWWEHTSLSAGKGIYITMAASLGGPMLWYMWRTRGWKQVKSLLPTAIPGAVLMFAMFVPWMLYMTHLFGELASGEFSEQVTERAAGVGAWSLAKPHYYFGALLTFTLPWVAFLPGALAMPLMHRFHKHRRGLVYCVLWCIGIFGLFTASAAKREHYILPMLPAMCLLMGFAAEEVFFKNLWIKKFGARLIGALYGPVGVLGAVAMGIVWICKPDGMLWPVLMGSLAAAAVPFAMAGWLAWKGRFAAFIPLVAVAMAVIQLGHWTFFASFDPRRPVAEFARKAAEMTEGKEVWGICDPQAKTVFYFGRQLPNARWRFVRMEKTVGKEQAKAAWEKWISDTGNAPYMIGYEETPDDITHKLTRTREARDLEKYGYKLILKRRGVQKKKLLFALYERKIDSGGATQPPNLSDENR